VQNAPFSRATIAIISLPWCSSLPSHCQPWLCFYLSTMCPFLACSCSPTRPVICSPQLVLLLLALIASLVVLSSTPHWELLTASPRRDSAFSIYCMLRHRHNVFREGQKKILWGTLPWSRYFTEPSGTFQKGQDNSRQWRPCWRDKKRGKRDLKLSSFLKSRICLLPVPRGWMTLPRRAQHHVNDHDKIHFKFHRRYHWQTD
jgi:hypothetical protein